jgi:hypothetical protein
MRQRGRLVFEREALLGGLQVRIAGAAEPDVGLGVLAFGDQLGQRLARSLQGHVDLGAGGARIDGGDHVAPLGLHRADDVDLPLRRGARRRGGQGDGCNNAAHGMLLRWMPASLPVRRAFPAG